jgi:putative addiction module component (TIGR02574 family)
MSNDPKHLDYSHLSIPERISLVQELWDSVHDRAAEIPLTEAEHQELERRWAAYESGSMTASPWPEVKQRLLEK